MNTEEILCFNLTDLQYDTVNVKTVIVHISKRNEQAAVPVDDKSVQNAIKAIEWAVKGILREDFPMRACATRCGHCDFKAMCKQKKESFNSCEVPPQINTPTGAKSIAAWEA